MFAPLVHPTELCLITHTNGNRNPYGRKIRSDWYVTCINYTKNGTGQRYSAVTFSIETWSIFLKDRPANRTPVHQWFCIGATSTMLCTCVHPSTCWREADPGSGEAHAALSAVACRIQGQQEEKADMAEPLLPFQLLPSSLFLLSWYCAHVTQHVNRSALPLCV